MTADKPTALDHFLFLLSEMERMVDNDDIRWPAGRTNAIKARLAHVLLSVGHPASRDEPPRLIDY